MIHGERKNVNFRTFGKGQCRLRVAVAEDDLHLAIERDLSANNIRAGTRCGGDRTAGFAERHVPVSKKKGGVRKKVQEFNTRTPYA